MDHQPNRLGQVRAWAITYPWRAAGVAAAILILVGVLGSLLADQPIRWWRTVEIGLLLASALGMLATAQRTTR